MKWELRTGRTGTWTVDWSSWVCGSSWTHWGYSPVFPDWSRTPDIVLLTGYRFITWSQTLLSPRIHETLFLVLRPPEHRPPYKHGWILLKRAIKYLKYIWTSGISGMMSVLLMRLNTTLGLLAPVSSVWVEVFFITVWSSSTRLEEQRNCLSSSFLSSLVSFPRVIALVIEKSR